MDCIDNEGKKMKDYIWAVLCVLVALLLLVCFVPRFVGDKEEPPSIIEPEQPDVWFGPECPEPEIVTVPVDRVITKIVHRDRPLKYGCNVDKATGTVYGVISMSSTYRLECYLQSDGSVRAKYIDMRSQLRRR